MDIMAYGGKAVKSKVKYNPMEYWNNLSRPPVNYYIPDMAINKLREYNNSARLMNNPVKKMKLVNELFAPYGFKSLASGTNRRTFYCEYDPGIIIKIGSDSVGCNDNLRDIRLQNFIKPYMPKVLSCTTDGIMSLIERVEVMTENDYRHVWANEVFDLIMTLAERGYIVEDIGVNFFKNLGVRMGFGPVLIDAPYIYKADPRKLKCTKVNPLTNQICGGSIDYNYEKGMSEIVCTKCGARYSAKYLSASEELITNVMVNEERSFTMENNIKVNVVNRKTGDIVNRFYTESDYKQTINQEVQTAAQPVVQKTNTPNVVVVSTNNVPEAVGQTQEPVVQQHQEVHNPNVVAIPIEHKKYYEEFLRDREMKKKEEEEKNATRKAIIFGAEYPYNTVMSIANKLNLSSVSDNTFFTLFALATKDNKNIQEYRDEVVKRLDIPELEVFKQIYERFATTLIQGTNPIIANTNANDQIVDVVPEEPVKKAEEKKVKVSVKTKKPEKTPVIPKVEPPAVDTPPAFTSMAEFAGIKVTDAFASAMKNCIPDMTGKTDVEIRSYLCRDDVKNYLIEKFKRNSLFNELKTFGGILAEKHKEDLIDINKSVAITIKPAQEEKKEEEPKKATTESNGLPTFDGPGGYGRPSYNGKRIPDFHEFNRNGKVLVVYPKLVRNNIFYFLTKIERVHGLPTANFLADRIGVEYIPHEEFAASQAAKNANNPKLNDQPKTVADPKQVVATTIVTSDASRKVDNSIGSNLDSKTIEKLKHIEEQNNTNSTPATPKTKKPVEKEKGEVVFQGQEPKKEESWKTRKEPVKVNQSENTEVTSNAETVPVQTPNGIETRPTEGLFPVKPQDANGEASVYTNMNTGSAVLGFPGESKVDTIRISDELPKLQEKVYVRFNNFTPSEDPAEDFAGKLTNAIREYIAPDVQRVMKDDGKGFDVSVVPFNDERNRSCYKVAAFNYGTQMFSTLIYPIGGQTESTASLSDGILYAQGKKQIEEFLKENPPEMQVEAPKVEEEPKTVKKEEEVKPVDVHNHEELVEFFNKKLSELDLSQLTSIEMGKRFVTASLHAALLDANKGSIDATEAAELAEKFVLEECDFASE